MKKLLVLLAISLCSYAVIAQSPINVGIHGGISSTKMKVKDIPQIKNSSARTGYMVGAFVRVNLGLLYLEPSLNYVHRESNISGDNGKLKVNSFDIPVMVGFNLIDISALKLRAYVGPVASFPGKVKESIKDFSGDLKTNSVMWNGKVGVGVDLWKFTFDIDYEKAFKKLGTELKAPRSFNFTLGFKII